MDLFWLVYKTTESFTWISIKDDITVMNGELNGKKEIADRHRTFEFAFNRKGHLG